ncbi:hypothetical protein RG47T_3828 [Mucilaginibacter polytrichastri]|uniref:Lipoprotein n=1 Tax=Mucilaginibacter polytrichastri TaxID=1302689 RepID=A0A1Q6A322_9SPHI|nr:hypothetical protein [Mucilaginibacter polytrichastri]OKS88362.1 hypothetical protein RG47T_3828 [Mucilaginibacter polytrichastri]
MRIKLFFLSSFFLVFGCNDDCKINNIPAHTACSFTATDMVWWIGTR